MSSNPSRSLFLPLLLSLLYAFSLAAPPVCRSCTKNCYQNTTAVTNNGTEVDDLVAELQSNRIKRDVDGGEVEFKACTRFQIEMLLIPLAIAMIPLVLTALILCTCCCGPKDSRGKLPDDFLAQLPMSKKKRLSSEELELEFRDGYVQRKDSSKTKFSTVVSYIEARRESLWSVKSHKDEEPSTSSKPKQEVELEEVTVHPMRASNDSKEDKSSGTPTAIPERLKKVPSTDSLNSIKRTRFSDTVSVISVESLPRRIQNTATSSLHPL